MDLTSRQLQKLAGIRVIRFNYESGYEFAIEIGALLVAYNNIYPFKTSEKARQIVEEWRKDPKISSKAAYFLAHREDANVLLQVKLKGFAFQIMNALDANPDILLNLTKRKLTSFAAISDKAYDETVGDDSLATAVSFPDGYKAIYLRSSNLNKLHPYKYENVRGEDTVLGNNSLIHEAIHISDRDDKYNRYGLMANSALFMHAFEIGAAGRFTNDKTMGFLKMILRARSYSIGKFRVECLSYYAETYYAGQFAEGCIRPEELSKPFKIFFDHIVNYGLSLSRAENPKLALAVFTEHMKMGIEKYNELCKKHGLPENLGSVDVEELQAAKDCPEEQAKFNAKFEDYCNKYETMCKELVQNIKQEVDDKTKLEAKRQESNIGGKWQQYVASRIPPVREL